MAFFSIVIPTLNEERFLPRLLTCLLKQTSTSFDITVVDGESVDDTQNVCRQFESRFAQRSIVLRLHSVPKRNVSYQRNYGAEHTSGEYLIFLDADVCVEKTFISTLMRIVKKDKPKIATTWLSPDTTDVRDEALVFLMNISTEAIRYTPTAFVPGFDAIVERKTFVKLGGFNEQARHAEDHLLSKKAKKLGITIRMYRKPVLTVSLRRFHKEGRLETIRRLFLSFLHTTFIGPITKEFFTYSMGGSIYVGSRKTIRRTKKHPKMPFYSIVIPTLNEETCLPRLFNDLLSQSFADFEIIHVDAHSEDKTVLKSKLYTEKFKKLGVRLTLLESDKRNISVQRNMGVKKAQGKYCVFLDADIQVRRGFLNRLYTVLSSEPIDVAGVWATSDRSDIRDRMVALVLSLAQDIPTKLKRPFIIGHCIIARKDVFKKIHFRPDGEPVEDYEFAQDAIKHKLKVAVFREPKVIVSLRRYRKYGRINTFLTYAHITSVMIFRGKKEVHKLIVEYPTGGHIHS